MTLLLDYRRETWNAGWAEYERDYYTINHIKLAMGLDFKNSLAQFQICQDTMK